MPGQCPKASPRDERREFLDAGMAGKADFVRRRIGKRIEAVLEVGLHATSEDYLKLKPRGLPADAKPGQSISCLVEGVWKGSNSSDIDAFALYTGPSRHWEA